MRSPKAGKPPAVIDIVQLRKLAGLNCTIEEAASFFNCCKRTMKRWLKKPEYADAWESGRQAGRLSLRRLQWQHANGKGSSAVQMTIHLSKHWLGESEKSLVEMAGPGGGPIPMITSAMTVKQAASAYAATLNDDKG